MADEHSQDRIALAGGQGAATSTGAGRQAPPEAPTVLHAEDDENEAYLLQHALRKSTARYQLQQVADGEVAIDYLSGRGVFADRVHHPLPVAVLLDLKMPRRNGFEVLEWVRAQPDLHKLPIIILTSSERPEDKARALSLGATAYITKSFDWGAVLEELGRLAGCPCRL